MTGAEIGIAAGGLFVSIAGLWVTIRSGVEKRLAEFVRKDVHEEREKALNQRFTTLELKLDDAMAIHKETQNIVRSELPKAVQEACVYGVQEGFKLARRAPRLAPSLPIVDEP